MRITIDSCVQYCCVTGLPELHQPPVVWWRRRRHRRGDQAATDPPRKKRQNVHHYFHDHHNIFDCNRWITRGLYKHVHFTHLHISFFFYFYLSYHFLSFCFIRAFYYQPIQNFVLHSLNDLFWNTVNMYHMLKSYKSVRLYVHI